MEAKELDCINRYCASRKRCAGGCKNIATVRIYKATY